MRVSLSVYILSTERHIYCNMLNPTMRSMLPYMRVGERMGGEGEEDEEKCIPMQRDIIPRY